MLCSPASFSLQIGIAILNAQIHIDGVTTVADRAPDVRRVVRAGVAILVMAVLKDVVARLDTSLVKFSCEFEQKRGYSEQDDMAGGSLCVRRSGVCLRSSLASMLFRATCALLSDRWLAHLATRDDIGIAILNAQIHIDGVTTVADRAPDVRRVVRAGVAILVMAVLKDVVARLDMSLVKFSCEFEQKRGYSEQDDMAGGSLCVRRSGVCLRSSLASMLFRATCALLSDRWLAHLATRDDIGIAILNAQIHIDGVTTVADRAPDVRRVVRAGVAILVMAVLKDVVARLDMSLVKFSCEFEQKRGYSEQDDMAGGSLCVRRSGVCLRSSLASMLFRATCALLSDRWLAHLATRDDIGIAILNAQIHIDGVTTVADRAPDVRRVVRAGVAILVMAVLKDVVARLDMSLVKFSCEFEQKRGYSEQDDMAGGSLCVRRSGVCLRSSLASMLFRATCALLSDRWLAHLATRDDIGIAILNAQIHIDGVTTVADRAPDVRRVVRAGVAILVMAVLKDVVARLDMSLCEFEQKRGYSEQDDMAGGSLCVRRSGVCLRSSLASMLFRATCALLSDRWLAHLATRDDVMLARHLFPTTDRYRYPKRPNTYRRRDNRS
ncbi:hypothetical protein KXD40_001589 [Peronospora effusa]|nr:hypothetical protein KXD40_001589 [Peronospora effusa]